MEFSFEKLQVFQASRSLLRVVYCLLDKFPEREKLALTSQLRRSIVSVPSNIAEGSGRRSPKEKVHFLEIAYGSLMEAYCQLLIALDNDYISDEELKQIRPLFFEVSGKITGLVQYFETNNNNQ